MAAAGNAGARNDEPRRSHSTMVKLASASGYRIGSYAIYRCTCTSMVPGLTALDVRVRDVRKIF